MKNSIQIKFVLFAVTVLFSTVTEAQTTTENYVQSKTYQYPDADDSTSDDQKIINVSYYDGLGRMKQNVAVKAGGDKENIVSFYQYDPLGMQSREYLPYATPSEITDGTQQQLMDMNALRNGIYSQYNSAKYENTLNPYTEMAYEVAPAPKLLEQSAPGNLWALDVETESDHSIKYDYGVNVEDDILFFEANITGSGYTPVLGTNRYYSAQELYLSITKDENWAPTDGNDRTVHQYTNRLGQTILKRHFESGLAHDTYYVYDIYGNLSFVIPPGASDIIVDSSGALVSTSGQIMDDFGYQYRYDGRNRVIETKVPGADWQYTVYDYQDRPILTQTAKMRTNNQWLFTKFDIYGRVAYTGLYTSSGSRSALQSTVDAHPTSGYFETQRSSLEGSVTIGDANIYYTALNAFPTSNMQILTVSYYDEYVDIPSGEITIPTSVYGQVLKTAPKGLPTVSKIRVLTTQDWTTNVNAYDEKNRMIFTGSHNPYLDTNDEVRLNLDFAGKTLNSYTSHIKGSNPAIVTNDYFTYDHQGRLKTHLQQVGDDQ